MISSELLLLESAYNLHQPVTFFGVQPVPCLNDFFLLSRQVWLSLIFSKELSQ